MAANIAMNQFLSKEIKYLPGVGPKKAELLQSELSIFTYGDLLWHLPYKYIDRSKFFRLKDIKSEDVYIQVKGKIVRFESAGEKGRKRLIAIFTDGYSSTELIWFSGHKWILNRLKTDKEYVIFGKPSIFNGNINFVHPDVEEIEKHSSGIQSAFQPYYSTTEKLKSNFLNSRAIEHLIESIFKQQGFRIDETLPQSILQQHKMLSAKDTLQNIHFPQSEELLKRARFRIKFEELFLLQLSQLRTKTDREKHVKGLRFEKVGDIFNRFYSEKLPFELTNAQKRVMREIRRDTGSGRQMNRLLQGDVGSGKTLVALMAMLLAVDNGFQACIMAPTEILATQHYLSIKPLIEDLDIHIGLLTGSTRKSERTRLHAALLNGSLNILIGTHALIEDVVQFKNLGMVVVDEQHKFGVMQRARLREKNDPPPHVLVMTATPIPRTLAMTIYGDLDVSVIDELPPGRKPIKTIHFYDSRRLRMHGLLREQLNAGRQAYVVFPLIKESEKIDYKDLEEGFESLARVFQPPQYRLSCVHGKMKADDKERSMRMFAEGKNNIMVATTVIEVGVNVPNATIMVIESAERFGLSQLHQLRGRVGRGGEQSFCILMTRNNLSNDGRKRIATMVSSNDGFVIAEEDLKMRGPGDIEGTQQSGDPMNLKLASLATDGPIVEFARNVASDLLDDDPTIEKPENAMLRQALAKIKQATFDFSQIS
jgi:ATP-dependent DNA helicase RecG